MFIVITGLDGSGTSTIAEKLHTLDQDSYLFHTPSEPFFDRRMIDKDVRDVSQNAHYLYYLSSVVYLSDYIRKNIDYKSHNVYCARYLIDTVVSHRVAGLNVDMNYEKYNILKPDFTIFVYLNEDIRQERITNRGKSILDYVLDDKLIREAFLDEYMNCMENSILFDNGISNVDEELSKLYWMKIYRGK